MHSREWVYRISNRRGPRALPDFADLGLAAPLLGALATEGYTTPTPIQSRAIPTVLSGRDLCGIAQTGSGKTAAFALPILQRLFAAPRRPASQSCRALVLSPTRELASQIVDSFRSYGAGVPISTAVIFGGVPIGPQRRRLARGLDVLVATPGRLLDLSDFGSLTLSSVEVLVLDEADRMLDLGFIHALKRIVKLLPTQRQTLLFSATMPRAIADLAEDFLIEPVKIAVTPPATTVQSVEQHVAFVSSDRKRDLLTAFLRDPAFKRVLVFTRTKHGADRVVRHLVDANIEATAIHGNKSQPQRERALADFRDGRARILVATDIAARGIDVDGVSHVINFDSPNVPEDYVHRIGRTARAGALGVTIAFCSDEERSYLREIEKLTRVSIRVIPVPPAVSVGAAANRPPETVLPRLGQSLSKQPPERGRTGAIRRQTSDRSERGEKTGAAGSIPALLQQRLPVTPASIRHRSVRRRRSSAA
jgi:ATP-dependent RNA helicase RhlE